MPKKIDGGTPSLLDKYDDARFTRKYQRTAFDKDTVDNFANQPGSINHRVSSRDMWQHGAAYSKGVLSKEQYIALSDAVAGGSNDTEARQAFLDKPTVHNFWPHYDELNDQLHNLRKGDASANQRIGQHFDPGVRPSATRKRERSLSPVSRQQVGTLIENGVPVRFRVGHNGHIQSSTDQQGIPPEQVEASIKNVTDVPFSYATEQNKAGVPHHFTFASDSSLGD